MSLRRSTLHLRASRTGTEVCPTHRRPRESWAVHRSSVPPASLSSGHPRPENDSVPAETSKAIPAPRPARVATAPNGERHPAPLLQQAVDDEDRIPYIVLYTKYMLVKANPMTQSTLREP